MTRSKKRIVFTKEQPVLPGIMVVSKPKNKRDLVAEITSSPKLGDTETPVNVEIKKKGDVVARTVCRPGETREEALERCLREYYARGSREAE